MDNSFNHHIRLYYNLGIFSTFKYWHFYFLVLSNIKYYYKIYDRVIIEVILINKDHDLEKIFNDMIEDIKYVKIAAFIYQDR